LDGHLIVLELGDKFINFGNEESILGVSVLPANKTGILPQFDNCLKSFHNVGLTNGEGRDLFYIFEMLVDASLEKLFECESWSNLRNCINKSPHLCPMLILHGLLTESSNDLGVSRDVLNLSLSCVKDFIFGSRA